MNNHNFNIDNVVRHLKHFLPAQAPLKDFIHHNTLHAFQHKKFFEAIGEARTLYGYKTALSLTEFRNLYANEKIEDAALDFVLHGEKDLNINKSTLLDQQIEENFEGRIGQLRKNWKKIYGIDLDLEIHASLFRFINAYLDQGVGIWQMPKNDRGFLATIKDLDKNSFLGHLKNKRAKTLLHNPKTELQDLLKIIVGDENLYEHYIFDQQMSHPGWSGMVSFIEDHPEKLIDTRNISLQELIFFECLLEIDLLDHKFGENWAPLSLRISDRVNHLFNPIHFSEYDQMISIWQKAFEWTHYNQVLNDLDQNISDIKKHTDKVSFQAVFCIDDRECSLRRHIESVEPKAETFGTPGFFGAAMYYKPMDSNFAMKVCPEPIKPKHIVHEYSDNKTLKKDFHFSNHTHSLLFGWIITHTLGFWSAVRLFINIFLPKLSPATTHSFQHMDKLSKLTIERQLEKDGELWVGFTKNEMVDIVENVLRSIGLVDNFSTIIYIIGHGASSVNNTHYAGYDCGACSGRPGSVNARTFCYMANHIEVRTLLSQRGININQHTIFVSGLHDTTRDEIEFYDEELIVNEFANFHTANKKVFAEALERNAVERAKRFELISDKLKPKKIYEAVKLRSFSLFEPRPELNHATNSLCIVGRRSLTSNLFLDRRAFLNSYDPLLDLDGKLLFSILSALAPVCGGINLEYYFSRVDNYRLGAGSKLPHNVMGLIGVANGVDGDLRTGLPLQMIELHDPVRLLMIIEQKPSLILDVIQRSESLFEWFANEWINLVSIDYETKEFYIFKDKMFQHFTPFTIGRSSKAKPESKPTSNSGIANTTQINN